MKIEVDPQACRAYANCVMESPDTFDIDDASGKVRLLVSQPDASLRDEVRAAVKACPVYALSLIE